MMQHIHYGDWTIEWEFKEEGGYDFYLCAEMREPQVLRTEIHRYWVKTSLDLEVSLRECHELIQEITRQQRRATMDTILSFHDKYRLPTTEKARSTSDMEDADRVPF